MAIQITLPALGDGIETADVLEVLVRPGDAIRREQGILEIETDKATVEVPSSHAGTVVEVRVREGESIRVGQVLITLDEAAETARPAPAAPVAAKRDDAAQKRKPEAAAKLPAQAAPAAPSPQPSPLPPPPAMPRPAATPSPPPAARVERAPERTVGDILPAGPAVRRFAREVGVDLHRIRGSGSGGRITREDVLAAVRRANQGQRDPAVPAAQPSHDSTNDAWGPIRTERMTKTRKTIAAKMLQSWTTTPRVTNFDDADVTELEGIRQASKDDYAAKGVKLTAMPFVIKSVAMALRDHPLLNAAIDADNEQIVFKQYIHIGIAVDTERGLIVPSLRHADRLTIPEIARQLAAVAESVRNGSFAIEDLRGSTFTISNLGAIGGTYSTPIINVPEVAILLVGQARKLPVVVDDEVAVRLMMPLSLSYDHRLVDGAAAARFLNDVIAFLEAPARMLLAP